MRRAPTAVLPRLAPSGASRRVRRGPGSGITANLPAGARDLIDEQTGGAVWALALGRGSAVQPPRQGPSLGLAVVAATDQHEGQHGDDHQHVPDPGQRAGGEPAGGVRHRRSAKGAAMTADISVIIRQSWPRIRIHRPMPMAMSAAIGMVCMPGRSSRSGTSRVQSGARSIMPAVMASNISPTCVTNQRNGVRDRSRLTNTGNAVATTVLTPDTTRVKSFIKTSQLMRTSSQ